MSGTGEFQAQIASIMEVLANAAVAEICKVVDDGYAVVHLEMSQSHKENEFLRRKIKLLELQIARFRTERMKFSEGSVSNRFGVRLLNRPLRDTQASGPSFQGRERSVSRTSAGRDRSPFHLNQDPASNCDVEAKNETTGPKQEEELDLLIVKVEGATGVDDPASSRDSERPPGGDRGLSPPSTTGQWDGAAGRNLTEGLASDAGEEHRPEEHRPEEHRPEEQRPENGRKEDGGDGGVHLHAEVKSEVKSEVIVIDTLPVGGADVSGDVTPSSLWSPGDSGQNPVHHVSQSGAYHGRSYGYDPRFQNTAAPVGMPTGEQPPAWAGLQENPTGLSPPSGHAPNPSAPLGPDPRPYKCAFCLRQYPHQCQLRIHERVHTGEKPYQCSQCGKQFGQFCSLKRHQRVHTGEKPYQCSQCGKQFSHSNNLKVHQSVHTGEKRFHCSQCGKNFSFLSNLIRHQAVHAAGK
ncbi:zinc finger protein 316-like isoform X2 [Hypomesus transpacificus]|uniref:zinc finger protein 316-like isoform X2 n=1 Tax=Hypomesus transpacificus TaxID=137520 RepID=UPI001F085D1A|nr:zinc finger protein 316-like isoform X2 [Hypomesus transpacificus]